MLQNSVFRTVLAISLGAISGALSRYYLGLWFNLLLGTEFPYSTLIINVSGCFVMGFFTTLSLERLTIIHPDVHLLVTTGFLGSYTTFSTYALDTAKLFEEGNLNMALLYWFSNVLLGLFSIQLGIIITKLIYIKNNL